MIESLQYITQGTSPQEHIALCQQACTAGVKWVQLRLKNTDYAIYLEAAQRCREITLGSGATLIINDNLDVALACEANGVHLGVDDLDIAEARDRTPRDFIIGGTANTFQQVADHYQKGANYVGVGPFRFTTTKDKLSPILGLRGYQEILEKMRTTGMNLPLIAIGGILASDVEKLFRTGVHGVAVSGLISDSSDKKTLVNELHKTIGYVTT